MTIRRNDPAFVCATANNANYAWVIFRVK